VPLAAVLAAAGDVAQAARLLGAADATRARTGDVRAPSQEAELEPFITSAQGLVSEEVWRAHYDKGLALDVEQELVRAVLSPDNTRRRRSQAE